MSGIHARLSPSGSKRWMACPGSLTLEAQIPGKDHNEYSDSGTAMHTVAAMLLTGGTTFAMLTGPHPLTITVSDPDEEPREVVFTEEMAETVQGYVDEVRQRAAGACEFHVEQTVDFSEDCGVEDQFGTADVIIVRRVPLTAYVNGQEAEIYELDLIDLKTGYRYVEVQNNSQLMIYALGALHRFDLAYDIRQVRLCIYQPAHGGMREWVCSVEELRAFAVKLRDRAQMAEHARASFSKTVPQRAWNEVFLNPNPNEDECAFCRAMPTCPAMRAKIEAIVDVEFDTIDENTVPDPATMPDDKLARMMDIAGLVEDVFKAVRAEVERRLLAGQPVEGWGLELGREGARAWTDPAAVEDLLRKTYRIPIEDAYDLKLISPTTAEKLAGYKAGKPVKSKTPPVIGPQQWKKLQPFIKRSPPAPSVKPAHVIKVPYTAKAPHADDFEVVPESEVL